MSKTTEIVDKFEYKGVDITVHKNEKGAYSFVYKDKKEEIKLSLQELKSFVKGPFSHTTINEHVIDMVEKSIKINNFLFNLKDLEERINKYK